MAISKVIYGNQTLIDITDTDATATTVQAGRKFYNGAGEAELELAQHLVMRLKCQQMVESLII